METSEHTVNKVFTFHRKSALTSLYVFTLYSYLITTFAVETLIVPRMSDTQVSFKLTDNKRFQGQLVEAYKKLRLPTLLLEKKKMKQNKIQK